MALFPTKTGSCIPESDTRSVFVVASIVSVSFQLESKIKKCCLTPHYF